MCVHCAARASAHTTRKDNNIIGFLVTFGVDCCEMGRVLCGGGQSRAGVLNFYTL